MSFVRAWPLVSVLLLSVIVAGAQDLGSSNKLFGKKPKAAAPKAKTPPRSKATAKTPAKPPAKRTTAPASKSSAKKKAPVKKTPAKTTARKPPATVKPKTTTATGTPPKRAKPKVQETAPAESAMSAAEVDERYEELLEQGNAARDERNYLSAEAAYRKAKTLKPKDARAVYGLGNLYSDQQRWDEAETAYRTALQIDPNDQLALIALSYVLVQPISAPDLGTRYEEAEKLARRAIAVAPRSALAHDQLGVAREFRGLIDTETENAYREAIRLDPAFAPAYAHLGRLLRRRGQDDAATRAYADALYRATDVPTRIVVADVMQSEQRFAESVQLLEQAVKDDPRNPTGLLLLGRAQMILGRFDAAEAALKRGLAVSTNPFMGNSLLGSLYARQGRFELAENALLQAARSVPPFERRRLSQQFEMVGDGYLKTGKRREAGRAYRQAIALDAETDGLAAKLARAENG